MVRIMRRKTHLYLMLFCLVFVFCIPVYSDTRVSSIKEAYMVLRAAMVNRESTVTIILHEEGNFAHQLAELVNDNTEPIKQIMVENRDAIYRNSYNHTGKGNEGDYIRESIKSATKEAEFINVTDDYLETKYTYQLGYYTTKAQETVVTNTIEQVIRSLNLDGKSKYKKIKAIYEFIINNVTYYDIKSNDYPDFIFTAYGALAQREAVCQGYSQLFYRLCNDCGINCRTIIGDSDRVNTEFKHSWNIVKCGNKYYECDPTWDADRVKIGRGIVYFMTGEHPAIHIADPEFRTDKFKAKYPISSKAYKEVQYKLVVKGGSGSGFYEPNDVPYVEAVLMPGTKFVKWVGNANFYDSDETSPAVGVIMNKNTEIRAEYEYVPNTKVSGKKYIVINGKYLSVKNNSKKTGAKFVMGKKSKSSVYKFVKSGKGYYIQEVNSKLYLRAKGDYLITAKKSNATKFTLVKGTTYRLIYKDKALTCGSIVKMVKDSNMQKQNIELQKAA